MKADTLIPKNLLEKTNAQRIEVNAIVTDSRHVHPGDIFVAIKGGHVDAGDYIPDAIKKGAAMIIAHKNRKIPKADIPIIQTHNPRLLLAQIAARFYPCQPKTIIAVTGTNGKTSICEFLRQIWNQNHINAASIGTLGIIKAKYGENICHRQTELTTPDPISLHKSLMQLAQNQYTHLAMEISSHALQQYRVDGVKISAAAFTNLSQDHMDYHASFEAYFSAKARLFNEVLDTNAIAVINIDCEYGKRLARITRKRGLTTRTIGENKNADFNIKKTSPMQNGLCANIAMRGKEYSCHFPLPGKFQFTNALTALALADAIGMDATKTISMLKNLHAICGRLEPVGKTQNGAQVIIDYAHTPDALENALNALRRHKPKKLIVVFGAGGDRDQKKRPIMGEVAHHNADVVYVTDDNPRSENPNHIRAQILQKCPYAHNIEGRQSAIETALKNAQNGDIVLIAGKGHETGQILKDQTIPFSDHGVVKKILKKMKKQKTSKEKIS